MIGILFTLIGMYLVLSVLAVGGGSSVIPELHKMAVLDHKWMTDQQFVDIFAITQATPGPGMLIVASIGYKAGSTYGMIYGIFCAFVATLAMFGPCFGLAYTVSRLYHKFEQASWHVPVQKGLNAIALGLFFAAALIVTKASDKSHVAYIITATAAILTAYTRFNPLLLMVLAGVLGYLGYVK
jgi:chromate transporter